MAVYIVALTGASGAVYGIRLVRELLTRGDDVELLISPSGFLLLEEELGLGLKKGGAGVAPPAVAKAVRAYLARAKGGLHPRHAKAKLKGSLRYTPADDLTSALASGSYLSTVGAMVVCPCSMGTLARISAGISGNLIERAADCMLKERGTLVLVPRETPLSAIHLENMLKLSRAGAVILPAMPAFYTHPETTDDMAAFIAGKILDSLKIDNDLYKRWKR